MANRIAGITVEIGGDTTKLSTALKTVNSEIRSTQSQLKDVNQLLKLDPGNTELLAQKHKLLAQAVDETKEKLQQLKEAAAQANEKFANGEISQQQYDALQREIIATEQQLEKLEKQADQSAVALQKLANTGENMKKLGDSVSSVGSTLTKTVTTPIVGLGTAAVKTAADFDSAMSQVQAVSGASGEELEKLRAKAREMGASTKFSAKEAADAMNYMAMAGWKTGDMLSGIEGIMNLAAASGEDLAVTSDILTDALTAFGLTAADSGHFADILAAASSNANTNVSMMGETFKYCAPVAGALGFSAEDCAEAIGLMANAGIKSSQSGTAMRTMLTSLTGEVKLSGQAFGDVVVQTQNADGSMRDLGTILNDLRGYFSKMTESEAAAAAEALVGKNAMSGFLAVMQAAPADIDKLSNAIANCDGKSKEMSEVMQNNLAGQLTILKSQLQELAISFGEILMPVIKDVVGFLQQLVDKLNSMDPATKETIVRIAAIAAVLGPVLVVVGKIISAVGTILTVLPAVGGAISAVTGAFGAMNAVMLANPIALVIAAIAALVAAFVVLWNKCDAFREFWINLWNGLKELFVTAWDGMKSAVSSAWEGIKESIISAWENVKTAVHDATTAVSDAFSKAWTGLKEFSASTWNSIKNTVVGISTNIKDAVHNTWSSLVDNTSQAMSHMRDGVVEGWNTIKSNTESLWGGIKDKVVSIAGDMKESFSNTIHNVVETFTGNLNTMKEMTSTGLQSIASAFGSKLGQIKDSVASGFMGVVSGVSNAMGNMVSTIKEKIGGVGKSFTDVAKNAFTWGKDIISNLINGIGSMISSLVNKVKSVASTIKDYIGFSEPEKGPLSNFHTYMPDMIDLMGEGIEGNLGRLKRPMIDLASAIIPGTQGVQVSQMQTKGQGTDISQVTAMLSKYLPQMANQKVVLDSGALVGELSDGLNRQLGKAYL